MSFDTPCEVVGVMEVSDTTPVPFIVVRIKDDERKEKFLLKTGEGVSWEVTFFVLLKYS